MIRMLLIVAGVFLLLSCDNTLAPTELLGRYELVTFRASNPSEDFTEDDFEDPWFFEFTLKEDSTFDFLGRVLVVAQGDSTCFVGWFQQCDPMKTYGGFTLENGQLLLNFAPSGIGLPLHGPYTISDDGNTLTYEHSDSDGFSVLSVFHRR